MPHLDEPLRQKWRPITTQAQWRRLKKRQRKIESSKRWKYINSAWAEKAGFIFTEEDRAMKKDWWEITTALSSMRPLREESGASL